MARSSGTIHQPRCLTVDENHYRLLLGIIAVTRSIEHPPFNHRHNPQISPSARHARDAHRPCSRIFCRCSLARCRHSGARHTRGKCSPRDSLMTRCVSAPGAASAVPSLHPRFPQPIINHPLFLRHLFLRSRTVIRIAFAPLSSVKMTFGRMNASTPLGSLLPFSSSSLVIRLVVPQGSTIESS